MRLRINIPNCNGSPGFEKAFHAYVSSVRSIVLAWLLVGLNGGPATAGSSSTRPWGRWTPPSTTPPARSPGVPHIRGSACPFLPHAFCLGRPAYWPSRCPHAAAAWDVSIGTFPVISVWRCQCWGISGLLCLRNSNGHCKWPCCWRWTSRCRRRPSLGVLSASIIKRFGFIPRLSLLFSCSRRLAWGSAEQRMSNSAGVKVTATSRGLSWKSKSCCLSCTKT